MLTIAATDKSIPDNTGNTGRTGYHPLGPDTGSVQAFRIQSVSPYYYLFGLG